MVSHAYQNETAPSLGAANCETVVTFVGSWGRASGVTSYADQNEPGRPGGLRTAKLLPLSCAPGADQNETSPSLGASGGSSGVTPYGYQNEASPSQGAASSETVATFGGCWRVQRNDVIRRPE